MAISPSVYNMGTVTVTAGSAVVEGALTAWSVNAVSGGVFTVDGVSIPIYSVEDDAHLTLALVWPAGAPEGSGLSYAISRESALAADATYVHNALVNVLRTLAISGVIPDGAGTLAERDALTPTPPKGYIWLRVEVGYDLELYIRGMSSWVGPYPLRGEQGTPGLGAGGYGLPLGGTPGMGLVKSGGGDGVASWQNIVSSVVGHAGVVTAEQIATATAAQIKTAIASAFIQTLLDDANASTARTTLGAQAALGYVPANKAGDTFTGAITGTQFTGPTHYATGNGATFGGVFSSEISATASVGTYNARFYSSFSGGVVYANLNPFSTAGVTFMFGSNGACAIPGALSKGSGTFLIDHPLDPLNRNLRHGFVEAPRYDLIYRGVATLVDGAATVDIDAASDMTPGTFAVLTTNAVVTSLQNQDGFARLRPGPITGGTFDILCEDAGCTDTVAWVVMAERNDPFVKSDADHNCDADGRFIPEFDKEDA